MMNRGARGKSSEHRAVVESPSLTHYDAGIVNQGFDSLTRFPSPSFFYIDNSGGWLDGSQVSGGHGGNGIPRRFTESWIELEQAYSCGSSSSTTNAQCRCCRKFCPWFVYLIIALCVIGFAAIISGILYMEVLHDMYEVKELSTNRTSTFTTASTLSASNTTSTMNSTGVLWLPTSAPLGETEDELNANVSSTIVANVMDSVTQTLTIVVEESSTSSSSFTNTINSANSTSQPTNVSSSSP